MDPDEIVSAIVTPENLQWAWQKVLRFYRSDPAWKDEIEITSFELNLKNELSNIADTLSNGTYTLTPIRPISQPKKRDEDGNLQVRQLFWIPVKDQVAWVAITSIIGPILDSRMPLWSFGNRLHRSTWYDENDLGKRILKEGPYRHSSGLIYRKFSQSWPLYRRYIYLTLRHIAIKGSKNVSFELEDADQALLDADLHSSPDKKISYLSNDYWSSASAEVYWASIDFEKFYPNLNLELVKKILMRELLIPENHILSSIFNRVMEFPLDCSGYSQEQLIEVGLDLNILTIKNLPTGLIVAGFLANVGMIEIDKFVSEESKKFQIAHFRYVDDHLILSNNFDNLVAWLRHYTQLVYNSGIASINVEKTVPEELSSYIQNTYNYPDYQSLEKIKSACQIDPVYPKPLMTKTLSRVSQLGRLNFEFLEESEQDATINDLELLLLADINDSELPETTRISFAATLISRFSAQITYPNEDLIALSDLNRNITYLKAKIDELSIEQSQTDSESRQKHLTLELSKLSEEQLLPLEKSYREKLDEVEKKLNIKRDRSYSLLLKAIHENPEKLRLWQRAVDFCFSTGYKGISKLQDELNRTYNSSHTAGLYIESLLYSYIAKTIIQSLGKVQYEDLSQSRRDEIYDFVYDSLNTLSGWRLHENKPYYFLKSFELLKNTALIAKEILYFFYLSKSDINTDKARLEIRVLDKEFEYFQNRQTLSDATNEFMPKWVWWAESVSAPTGASTPTNIWAYTADTLDESDNNSWLVWQKYPQNIPEKAREAILNGSKIFSKGFGGWLIDAMYDSQLNSFDQKSSLPIEVSSFLQNKGNQGLLSVYEWAKWMKSAEHDLEFDPRFGEWTCLEIIRQILEKLISLERHNERKPIHPANIFIPLTWKYLDDDCLLTEAGTPTWESWNKIITNNQVTLFNNNELIYDYRFKPESENNFKYDESWLDIRSVSLILLGLLRKDFTWPSLWNIPDHSPYIHNSQRKLISEIDCSSMTSAILESTLLPRSRESFLIEKHQSSIFMDSDTTYDPPPIRNIFDFYNCVINSQNTIRNYQFTVQGHKPIQLVPLQIEQLHRFITEPQLLEDAVDE